MVIYTTYFANVKNLPSNIIPIAICGRSPEWWNGLEYKRLAPKWEFFKVWKENHDNDFYIREFKAQVLDKLNAKSVVRELSQKVTDGNDVALVCYEKPLDFCHRHLVSAWLRRNGFESKEWEPEEL